MDWRLACKELENEDSEAIDVRGLCGFPSINDLGSTVSGDARRWGDRGAHNGGEAEVGYAAIVVVVEEDVG